MARSKEFIVKVNVVKALMDLSGVSYYHHRQLVADGYLVPIKDMEAKKPGRGRAPIRYEVSKSGKNLMNLAKNWAAFKTVAA